MDYRRRHVGYGETAGGGADRGPDVAAERRQRHRRLGPGDARQTDGRNCQLQTRRSRSV